MRLPVAISCEWCSRASVRLVRLRVVISPAGYRAQGPEPCPPEHIRATRQPERRTGPGNRQPEKRAHAANRAPRRPGHPANRAPRQPASRAPRHHPAERASSHPAKSVPRRHPARRTPRSTGQPSTPPQPEHPAGDPFPGTPPARAPGQSSTPPTEQPATRQLDPANPSTPPQPEHPAPTRATPAKEPLTSPPGTHSPRGARFRCTACPPGMRTWARRPGRRAGRCSRSSGSPGSGRSRSGTSRN